MTTHVETIQPRDGQTEDRIVFGGIALILLGASLLLYTLYPPTDHHFTAIPKPLRATLTALSNAGEEILILRELEGNSLALNSIVEAGITPFATSNLKNVLQLAWYQNDNCYLGQTRIEEVTYQVRLLLPALRADNQTDEIATYWRHVDTNKIDLNEACPQSSTNWHSGSTLAQSHKDLHDH